jgi:hypothetical protein
MFFAFLERELKKRIQKVEVGIKYTAFQFYSYKKYLIFCGYVSQYVCQMLWMTCKTRS